MESPHTTSSGQVTLCAHRFDDGVHILDLTAWNYGKGNTVSVSIHDVTLAELISMRDALTKHIRATRAYSRTID